MNLTEPSPEQTYQCRRCGQCCRKGGPALHLEDKALIESGRIPLNALFTIRAYETVHDNVRNITDTARSDIIKIKGAGSRRACMFYEDTKSGCTVYAHRPVECRILTCWDTREIESLYNRDRLTRKDVVGHIQGLWELISEHQKRCDYRHIDALMQNASSSPDDVSHLSRIIQYDLNLRNQILQKGMTDPGMLDFLLGRPLSDTLAPLGFRIK